jgi:hypothetical protein
MIEGGCFCGALRYEIEGEPMGVTHCHCIHCRRTSGAPFITWAEVETSRFRYVKGSPGSYSSRPTVTREFCTGCGTQLTYRRGDNPAEIDVTVGSFDSPESVRPVDHVWIDRMLPWAELKDGLPRHTRDRE